jgi:hypothetical protein
MLAYTSSRVRLWWFHIIEEKLPANPFLNLHENNGIEKIKIGYEWMKWHL